MDRSALELVLPFLTAVWIADDELPTALGLTPENLDRLAQNGDRSSIVVPSNSLDNWAISPTVTAYLIHRPANQHLGFRHRECAPPNSPGSNQPRTSGRFAEPSAQLVGSSLKRRYSCSTLALPHTDRGKGFFRYRPSPRVRSRGLLALPIPPGGPMRSNRGNSNLRRPSHPRDHT